jgi:adenylosuccinate lyase
MLKAISPIDGRYSNKTNELSIFFSEFGLIRYRVYVEIEYLLALSNLNLDTLDDLSESQKKSIKNISTNFSEKDAEKIKEIERTTNHDVKAVEYFIKAKLEDLGLSELREFVHFALTSQDINNTSLPLSIKDALENVYYPELQKITEHLVSLSKQWKGIPMLARTHGQAASPTSLGKEIRVYIERLYNQLDLLKRIKIQAKFGGATGNFNAHKVSYPDIDWKIFADRFIKTSLGLTRQQNTTQISHYDDLAAVFHAMSRINVILIDFCRDIWTYISMDYFGQKIVEGEIGSSTMPHKVNPIDYENAEGNLCYANAVFEFLARKLPVSRLQRDLTDSTVTRNVGVPFAHTIIAFKSIMKGLGKLKLNQSQMESDLESNWAVVAEAIQSILRREQFPNPYEELKKITRGNNKINKSIIHNFIDTLQIDQSLKKELKNITPQNYLGYT